MFSRRCSRWLRRQVQDVTDIAARARRLKRVSRRALVRQDRVGTRRPAPTFARCRPLLSCSTLQDLIAGSVSREATLPGTCGAGTPEAPGPAPVHARSTREDLVKTTPQGLAHDSSDEQITFELIFSSCGSRGYALFWRVVSTESR